MSNNLDLRRGNDILQDKMAIKKDRNIKKTNN